MIISLKGCIPDKQRCDNHTQRSRKSYYGTWLCSIQTTLRILMNNVGELHRLLDYQFWGDRHWRLFLHCNGETNISYKQLYKVIYFRQQSSVPSSPKFCFQISLGIFIQTPCGVSVSLSPMEESALNVLLNKARFPVEEDLDNKLYITQRRDRMSSSSID